VSRRAFEALGSKMSQTVVGSGPYVFDSWEPNNRVVLRANPAYAGGQPAFERIVLRPIEDAKTAQLALRSGEIDFTELDPGAIREVQAAGLKVVQLESINYVWIGLNVAAPLLSDLRVRQAIRLAIDTDQVVTAAYNGWAKPIRSVMAPGLLGAWPEAPVYRRDPAAAKALLAQAGVKPGQAVKLTVLATPIYQTVALVVRAQLAEVGLDVQIDARPAGTFWSSGKDTSLELSVQRFGGQPDPAFQTQWFVSSQIGAWNWQRWNSPAFDALHGRHRGAGPRLRADAAADGRVGGVRLADERGERLWRRRVAGPGHPADGG
jgi:peptide/nickel transport system substrate-binding protein